MIGGDTLCKALIPWLEELDSLKFRSVSILGNPGAGKSTLLNAIMEASILPALAGNDSVTGAAISIQRHRSPDIIVEVVLMTTEECRTHFSELLRAIGANISENAQDEPADTGASAPGDYSPEQLDALHALADVCGVYCDRVVQNMDNLKETVDRIRAFLNDTNAIQDLMEMLSSSPLRESFQDADSACKHIGRYCLSAPVYAPPEVELTNPASKPVYWPLVKEIRIFGDFRNIPDNVILLDLPGERDRSKFRQRITASYSARCDLVWFMVSMEKIREKQHKFEKIAESLQRKRETVKKSRVILSKTVFNAKVPINVQLGQYRRPIDAYGINYSVLQESVITSFSQSEPPAVLHPELQDDFRRLIEDLTDLRSDYETQVKSKLQKMILLLKDQPTMSPSVVDALKIFSNPLGLTGALNSQPLPLSLPSEMQTAYSIYNVNGHVWSSLYYGRGVVRKSKSGTAFHFWPRHASGHDIELSRRKEFFAKFVTDLCERIVRRLGVANSLSPSSLNLTQFISRLETYSEGRVPPATSLGAVEGPSSVPTLLTVEPHSASSSQQVSRPLSIVSQPVSSSQQAPQPPSTILAPLVSSSQQVSQPPSILSEQDIDHILTNRGLVRVPRQGLGDCLYDAIAVGVGLSGPREVRSQTYAWANPHPTIREHLSQFGVQDPQRLIERMNQDRQWGGEEELTLIASALNHNIVVFRPVNGQLVPLNYGPIGSQSSETCRILYNGVNHYEALAQANLLSTSPTPLPLLSKRLPPSPLLLMGPQERQKSRKRPRRTRRMINTKTTSLPMRMRNHSTPLLPPSKNGPITIGYAEQTSFVAN